MIDISFDSAYMIITKGSGVTNNIPKYPESVAIIAVQSIVRAKPHKAVMILINAGYRIVRQAVLYANVLDGVSILRRTNFHKKQNTKNQVPQIHKQSSYNEGSS